MSNRSDLISNFIASTSFSGATQTALASDASKRSYIRLVDPNSSATALVMNAPPEAGEDVRPFVKVTQFLRGLGLSAPEIYAEDTEAGFLLIEDFGDRLFANECAANPELEHGLYVKACQILVNLHDAKKILDVPDYSLDVYETEAKLLTDWYLPATGSGYHRKEHNEYAELVRALCHKLDTKRKVTVMRDYHAENLMLLDHHTGLQSIGLLDYQDALIGHPAYDLVSLLQDARRDTSPELQDSMVKWFIDTSRQDPETFLRDYAIIGAQRNLKIVGIFARLWLRDGKPSYLDLIPRVWNHLQTDLQHPALFELKEWIAVNVPAPTERVLNAIRTSK